MEGVLNSHGYLVMIGSAWSFPSLGIDKITVKSFDEYVHGGEKGYVAQFNEHLPLKEYGIEFFNGVTFVPYRGHEEIITNKIITPDGTTLSSFHRHDFKAHEDKNGQVYGVDGGLDYLRRIGNQRTKATDGYREASVIGTSPFLEIREALTWGTRNKDGDQPVGWVKLSRMSDDHLNVMCDEYFKKIKEENLLTRIQEYFWKYMKMERIYRQLKGIKIEE